MKNPDTRNGIVVTDVQKGVGNQFCKNMFTYKYKGNIYVTAYAWALIKNTPENIQLLKERNELHDKIDKLQKEVKTKNTQIEFIS